MLFPVSKAIWHRASGKVTISGSLSDWKQQVAPFPCNSKSDFPMEKCPLAPWEEQAMATFQEPSTSRAGSLFWQWEVQSDVLTALIRRIHYLLFCANSPEKPDNMTDILKWFSFVTGKSLQER